MALNNATARRRSGFPSCVQCGTRSNACRCKVVGPTLGFLAFAVAAVVEWPLGAVVYLFKTHEGVGESWAILPELSTPESHTQSLSSGCFGRGFLWLVMLTLLTSCDAFLFYIISKEKAREM
ncbi:hypothetical protein OIU77_001414 [Salix suchowensis]|uniref:Uncharacterized protein n=1 Tax=Salix suchowensis TaxID=1278906 RepID=A0ABQ9B1J3_9ROSI|nr:hypothetical protein OIU77_001414 [Salix suchowensis]